MTTTRTGAAFSAPVRASDAALILIAGAVSLAFALQGWRARVDLSDLLHNIDAARDLLARAVLPERGYVTSFGSYAPPGWGWMVTPGLFLSSDLRLADVPANVVLHVGTLAGIFLLSRLFWRPAIGHLAVVLYAGSEHGLAFAGGDWHPRGHPFFYVWIAYWTCRWALQRDPRYLAVALLTWILGMFTSLEIAPAVLIPLAVWILCRPSLRARHVLVLGAAAVLLWYPYLRFEASRGFRDVGSQVLRESIAPEDTFRAAWCDPALTLHVWDHPSAQWTPGDQDPSRGRVSDALTGAGRAFYGILLGVIVNFQRTVTGGGIVLLAFTAAGLLALSAVRLPALSRPALIALGLFAAAAAANEVVIGRLFRPGVALTVETLSNIRTLQVMLAAGGLAVVLRRPIGRFVSVLRLDPPSADGRILVAALLAPWVALLVVSDWGRLDRVYLLWPLQLIVLASAVLGARLSRFVSRSAAVLVVALVLSNTFLWSKADAWRRSGWSGSDSDRIRVADALAAVLRADGKDHAAIGYRLIAGGPPRPAWMPVDHRWKIGHELDGILEYHHGIRNDNRCGEGLSAEDEYRIVETAPPDAGDYYFFDVPPAVPPQRVGRVGRFDLFRRP